MDSLVGYGSDEDNETERYHSHRTSGFGGASGAPRRREDGDNYDDVNMDLSEESESEPELPPAEPTPRDRRDRDQHKEDRTSRERTSRDRTSGDRDRTSRDKDRKHSRPRDADRRSPHRSDSDRRSPHRIDKRADKSDRRHEPPKRGLLGDRPDRRPERYPERSGESRVPALMDVKVGDPGRSHDARDAVCPRFTDRGDRRDRDRGDGDRDKYGRDKYDKRSGGSSSGRYDDRPRGRDGRGPAFVPATSGPSSSDREAPASTSEYRPSYKVNKKLEVMEKMGLQIKTPDGSMATAQQLRAAAGEAQPASSGPVPVYYNGAATKVLDQVQKRKLLWAKKDKPETETLAKWSGTRFAQDNDGKQVSKFMRLMGVKEPAAIKPEPVNVEADPIKKQEELFEAMQAQYEVARATTHTMRGVGLGFQRGQF